MSNPNKRKKVIKIIATIVVVLAVGGIVVTSYQKKAQKAKAAMAMNNPNALQVEAVKRQDLSSLISATGSVEAEKIYTISLSNNQEISKVIVNLGDKVTKGQTLIEYDYLSAKEKLDKNLEDANISLKNAELSLKSFNVPKTAAEISDLQNAIVTAEKNLYQAELDLTNNKTKIEDGQKAIEDAQKDIEYAQIDIDNAQKEIDNAKKEVDNAKLDLDNNKQLLDIGAISEQDYKQYQTAYDNKVSVHDSKVTAYNNALKAYDSKVSAKDTSVKNLEELKSQTKSFEYNIETAKYNVEKANRDLKEAKNPTMTNEEKIKYEQQKLQIESCKIKIADIQSQIDDLTDVSVSPIDGVIIEKNVEDGDIAKEAVALLKVADTSQLKVSATVSEYDASTIKLGQTVKITSDGIRDKIYTGKITFIDPQAKKSGDETGVTIDASIDNSDEKLKPGFSVDIEVTTAAASNALVVPITSILTGENLQKYIFTVTDGNKLKRVDVETGVYGDMYVEVKTNLAEGDSVISMPNASMKDGDIVEIASSNPMNDGGMENGDIKQEQDGSAQTVTE